MEKLKCGMIEAVYVPANGVKAEMGKIEVDILPVNGMRLELREGSIP
ncbi:hypothetical protein QA612_21595 [Evansella sp. AB-P1]|nr:hypothetical protein [Evansella sp. AB-P1]MDG5790053.1 hypothetical protein [Evansella sp. AB-P1]